MQCHHPRITAIIIFTIIVSSVEVMVLGCCAGVHGWGVPDGVGPVGGVEWVQRELRGGYAGAPPRSHLLRALLRVP